MLIQKKVEVRYGHNNHTYGKWLTVGGEIDYVLE